MRTHSTRSQRILGLAVADMLTMAADGSDRVAA